MILNILNDSIRYTFSNPKTFIKIIFCEIFSIFIIPLLIICGFQYRIIEDSLTSAIFEESELQQLTNFKNLLKNGIKTLLVKIVYLSVPLIISYMVISNRIPKMIGILITGILFIILYTYCFIAISNMVYHNSFKKAFALNEISVVKNKIGLVILFGLIMAVSFIFYGVVAFLDDFVMFLGNFININQLLFPPFTVYKLLLLFISNLTIKPFIDILTARIAGLIYENGSET